jgi:predicted dinucleotide-binding enzyme
MRLGIIGAGSLGSALGKRLGEQGHEIMFGGGTSAHEAASRCGARAGSNADAAGFGEIVVLAVPFGAVDGALAEAGPLHGRIVWSCVNALKHDLSGLAVGFDTSAAEQVARHVEGGRVVSAVPPFAHALVAGELAYDRDLAPTVFVCGDDPDSKRVVEHLIRDLGAHPIDAGPLRAARLIEPAMMLLVSIAYAGIPRDVGLRLLERTTSTTTTTGSGDA